MATGHLFPVFHSEFLIQTDLTVCSPGQHMQQQGEFDDTGGQKGIVLVDTEFQPSG